MIGGISARLVLFSWIGVCTALFVCSPVAGQGLPQQVQADLAMEEITSAIHNNQPQVALDGIRKYRKLGISVPPRLMFAEAKLALLVGDPIRAESAITEYLRTAPKTDPSYAAAISAYAEISQKAKGALDKLPPSRQPGGTFRDSPEAPEMVVVPSGSFLMGSASGIGNVDEHPQHQVTIRTFAVGKYEVTGDEWAACVSASDCSGKTATYKYDGRKPTSYVNWTDAQAYIAWLSRATGKKYRLLSEAEWEYAARSGTTTKYAFGETISTAQATFNYSEIIKTVGGYLPNSFGLHDMHGNVHEWVQDCYIDSYEGAPSNESASVLGDCNRRVIRGGAFNSGAENLRSAFRLGKPSSLRDGSLGFRVAREID